VTQNHPNISTNRKACCIETEKDDLRNEFILSYYYFFLHGDGVLRVQK
jgi:hypothetical protein